MCFAHAGGAASAFRTWHRHLPEEIELHAVQYPGRQDRFEESHVDDMDAMAEAITAALRPLRDRPLALLGHSMGAAVAYEVMRRLESEAPNLTCERLFVSGRPAPEVQRPGALHRGDDDGLIEDVRRLGAIAPETLADPTLRGLFIPTLRADYRLIERYSPSPGPALRTPVTALIGEEDPEVTREEALAWSRTTSGSFALRDFPGDHFYLTTQEPQVVDAVAATLTPAVSHHPSESSDGRFLR
ncbi:thioesterase II family protein [Nocardiopsis rhodophaea]|uniref:thioesterase II family protein n=1 Tax=Nocardiopsis rhodophaea TaxID=280238 RepID=UPI0031DFF98F